MAFSRSLASQLDLKNELFLQPFRNGPQENLCFANAAVSFLMNTPLINSLPEEDLLSYMKKYLVEKVKPLNVHPFLVEVDRIIPGKTFSNFRQHDSTELVAVLLAQLHPEYLRNNFLIQYSELKSCSVCNHVIQRDDEESIFQMKSDNFSSTIQSTLNSCLQKATEEECVGCPFVIE